MQLEMAGRRFACTTEDMTCVQYTAVYVRIAWPPSPDQEERHLSRACEIDDQHRHSYRNEPSTVRTTLRTGCARVLLFCHSCRHQADADLWALVEFWRGDVTLTELRFRSARSAAPTASTSRDVVRPW